MKRSSAIGVLGIAITVAEVPLSTLAVANM
jgi:hypothetical protein